MLRLTKKRFFVTIFLVMLFVMGSSSLSGFSAETPRFPGAEITLVVNGEWHARPIRSTTQEWERMTGAKVNLVIVPIAVQFSKMLMELREEAGVYDLVMIKDDWLADFAPYFYPLDEYITKSQENRDWYDGFLIKGGEWGGRVYTVQTAPNWRKLAYRKDLFEDWREQANFFAKYGYHLEPPRTWEQFVDMAEFFTRKPGDQLAGETLTKPFYGNALFMDAWGLGCEYLMHLGPYLKEPRLFDWETMEPTMASPAGVKAMEVMVNQIKYGPPDNLQLEYYEVCGGFLQGKWAMVVTYDIEMSEIEDPDLPAYGKVGYALVPGAEIEPGVINIRVMLTGNHGVGLSKMSKNKDAAFDYLKYYSSGERAVKMMEVQGYQWSRVEQIHSPVSLARIQNSLECFANLEETAAKAWWIRSIPGIQEYNDAIVTWAGRALLGEISAEEAVEGCSVSWREITKRRGLEKQKEMYKKALTKWQG